MNHKLLTRDDTFDSNEHRGKWPALFSTGHPILLELALVLISCPLVLRFQQACRDSFHPRTEPQGSSAGCNLHQPGEPHAVDGDTPAPTGPRQLSARPHLRRAVTVLVARLAHEVHENVFSTGPAPQGGP